MPPDAPAPPPASLRVAYVCTDPGIPAFGSKGASIHVQEVLRTLVKQGHRPLLFTPRPGGDPPAGLEGVEVILLPLPEGRTAEEREGHARAVDAALTGALEASGPFDLLYQRYALWSDAGMRYAAARGIPGVLEVNAPLVSEQAHHRTLVNRQGAEQVTASAFDHADVLVAVSEGVAAWVRGITRHPERVHVVPNGVDPGRFQPRDPGGPTDSPFTLGFVGSLKAWHGVSFLLQALALLGRMSPGKYRLLVVGDGPERSPLEKRAAELGVAGEVTFTGAVPPHRIPLLLSGMDVAVAPYPAPGAEGFYFSPLKIFEYLAAGVPTVASRVGQIEEVITDGVHGLLVPPGDPAALAEALERLEGDRGLRQSLAVRGRRLVLEHHGWDRTVSRILALAGLPQSAAARSRMARHPALVEG